MAAESYRRGTYLANDGAALHLYSVDVTYEAKQSVVEATADVYAYSELEALFLLRKKVKNLLSHTELEGLVDRSYLRLGKAYNPKPRVVLHHV